MSKILGEEVPKDNLGKLIFSGGKNKYRSAFLQANGHYLKEFAKKAREAVDSVNPNIRLGPCACMSVWDFDGVSAAELSRIMAGNTKPFLRLIGAPYWSVNRYWGNRLQDVIELERMEASWCGEGIDLLAEGDAYPRPRFVCPANVLEGFDMALRASGALTGIHKYTLDYTADPEYENGYNTKHIKNKPLYAQIEKSFAGQAAATTARFLAGKYSLSTVISPSMLSKPTSMPWRCKIFAAVTSKIKPFSTAPSSIYFTFSPNAIPTVPKPLYTVGMACVASILAAGEKNMCCTSSLPS